MFIPEKFKEIETGIFESVRPVTDQTFESLEYSEERNIEYLKNDFVHYKNLLHVIEKEMPEIIGKYKKSVAIGGGHPKFETVIMKAKEVNVFDLNTKHYTKMLYVFRIIFAEFLPNDFKIGYNDTELKPFPVKKQKNTCVTFIHFLEHCPNFETMKKWLEIQKNDVVIYQPCINAAKDANWWHYKPMEHNVFITIEAIEKLCVSLGYKVKTLRYSDDMLVYLTR